MLLCFCASVSAQIRFEDFSNTSYINRYLQFNGYSTLGTWNEQAILRLTDGTADLNEGSTVYFQDKTHIQGIGKQPVAGGFTTWFAFQVHSPIQCCTPGDGVAFIVQNSTATDSTMCASGFASRALGAGGNPLYPECPNQAGALGYAGINNNLVIEFDVVQDAWDPNANHIAIQTCGPDINTPVHLEGEYIIGNNNMVTSCLLSQQSIDTVIPTMGAMCNGESCMDGSVHNVVIGYTPPKMGQQQGLLQVWLDPTFVMGTHIPKGMPTMSVPYNIVYDPQNNPSGLQLDPANGGSAWVGFTASQPAGGGEAQDVFGWEFTLSSPVQITQTIQPGGVPTVFAFGAHQTTVTYPQGFSNPNGITMTVTATPVDRQTFYQTRLAGTNFSNEQCIVYGGTSGGGSPPSSTNGNCVVYSYMCQENGNQVTCPSEVDPTIVVNTTFDTMDNVTPTNADYLENDAIGSNNWMSIFTSFQTHPIDGTTSGGARGFGSGGASRRSPVKSSIRAPQVGSADIVATFTPSKP
jgi:Legume lectin domain